MSQENKVYPATNAIFNRTELLLGKEFMSEIRNKRVILFGTGGVGSWCAEGLVRSGIEHMTIVDFDTVNISNINRQLMATTNNIGKPKVEELKNRLLSINPNMEIISIQDKFSAETVERFNLNSYEYIIDAIDSLENKALLIIKACETNAVLFSSMGAALKLDTEKIAVTEFWKVKGCPLARALRQKFKRQKLFPRHKFLCVYSDELLKNKGESDERANGSLVHITATFGMTLSGLVIQDINKKSVSE